MASLPVIEPPNLEVPSCCGSNSQSRPNENSSASANSVISTRFHFALNVSEIERSVEFYRKLFGVAPAKHHADYAKFELSQPPLVFSLVPSTPGSQGALSHLGFPVASRDEVAAAAARLEAAGLTVTCQDGTVCGYARQDKVWVSDPDNNFWEIYVVHEHLDPETVRTAWDGQAPSTPVAPANAVKERLILEHRVTDACPDHSQTATDSVDEIRLTGTFNSSLSESERSQLLSEAFRILRSGGEIHVHGLVSNIPLNGITPSLPGVASLVKRIPVEQEPLQELLSAGFVGTTITKLPEASVFQTGAIEMREIRVIAFKPEVRPLVAQSRTVVYKGPFASITDDLGNTYQRGQRVTVTSAQEELLSRSASAGCFLFIQHEATCNAGC
ncbi:MAG: ArsI/CadI family heavy metal resistance metalloenzyme [Planctomycetaceae bacterium]